MSITGAFIMPHPPIILPQIGQGEEKKIQKTITSCKEIAHRIAAIMPDTIVITSPHSTMYPDYFQISPGSEAKGDLSKYGVDEEEFQMSVEYDCDFVSTIQSEAAKYGIAAGTFSNEDTGLDHGTIVPLSFIHEQYADFKLVRIGLSWLPISDHYVFGECISMAADIMNKNIVFVASGNLSNKGQEANNDEFTIEGIMFDEQITKAMKNGDFLKFLTFDETFTKKAGAYGLRSFIIMAGALDGKDVKSELLSYEGILGVGHGVASFIPCESNENRKFLDIYKKLEKSHLIDIKVTEDEYVKLAKYSIENFIKTGKIADLPHNLPDEMLLHKAGVFVSLKKHGNLRGCIGTITPVTRNIASEILKNAVNAATKDPRFEPVNITELSEIVYSVDVLSQSEPVSSTDSLNPELYGVLVTSGHKRGLLLPDLEGVDTPEKQIEIACRKAGIIDGEEFNIERFEVTRHR
ncbi:MAG: AmmeMemoRadiSam system protein A [Synergistaceae bacterium]|nr:AmmeMemoRadiSam system protein A [Synergistaceae bacterium]